MNTNNATSYRKRTIAEYNNELPYILAAMGRPLRDIVEVTGMSEATFYRMSNRQEFKRRVNQIRDAMISANYGKLISLVEKSIGVIDLALESPNVRNRLKAAQMVLDATMSFRGEVALAERIAALEKHNEQLQARLGRAGEVVRLDGPVVKDNDSDDDDDDLPVIAE